MNQLIALLLAIAPVPSPSAPKTSQQIVDAELPSLLAIYTDLHAHPELSGHEAKTSAVVARELRAAGCEVTENVGKYENPALTGYGVVGLLKNGPGPTVLIRSDLDGLPVTEETGLPFASKDTATDDDGQTVGVMHACGHDIHMSSLIGAARVLSRLKDQWSGTIVFVGQPAEETGIGARALLKDGLYTRWPKPDFVLGLHDSAQIAVGRIGVTEGYAYANVDSVDVTVRGVGGHGAYPHKTKDPIVLAAEMILEWQTIASRENNPLDPVVVTVGSIHGGSKHNVIPDEVKLQLTVRSYKADVRERVLAAIDRIAQGCAVAAGFPPDRMPVVTVRRDEFTPATYNNPELTRRKPGAGRHAAAEPALQPVRAGSRADDPYRHRRDDERGAGADEAVALVRRARARARPPATGGIQPGSSCRWMRRAGPQVMITGARSPPGRTGGASGAHRPHREGSG